MDLLLISSQPSANLGEDLSQLQPCHERTSAGPLCLQQEALRRATDARMNPQPKKEKKKKQDF